MAIQKLVNICKLLLIIISLVEPALGLVQLTSNQTKSGFNKLIWSYWDQGYDQLTIFTKLCIQNKISIGQQFGWKHIFIQKSTLFQYIEISQFNKYFNALPAKTVTLKSDIVRYLLLQRYGGMWMDTNTYFIRNLQWAQNLDIKFLQNTFGVTPDIILASLTQYVPGGNLTFVFDTVLNKTMNVFPRYEGWFILSKPNNQFISNALDIMLETFSKTKEVMDAELLSNGIFVDQVIRDLYFVASDYIFQIAIQRKQKQLQANHSSMKYAFQYYKINHFEGANIFKIRSQYNPYMYPMWADITLYTIKQVDPRQDLYLFRKFSGWHYSRIQFSLSNYALMNCWGMGLMVQKQSEVQKYLTKYSEGKKLMNQIYALNNQSLSRNVCFSYIQQKYLKYSDQSMIENASIYALIVMSILFIILNWILSKIKSRITAIKTENNDTLQKVTE